MHVSEIRVKQIRVKQGLSVEQFFSDLEKYFIPIFRCATLLMDNEISN